MAIARIFGRILRWVLSGYCAACNKKTSDLDNACHTCDRLMGPEVARVPAESKPRSE